MLLDQDVEHDAVDLVIDPVVGDDAHALARLPVAIDATLTLFVARRVPREVVVHHRIKVFLQIDPLAQTVSADEYALRRAAQLLHALLALGWRQHAGHRFDRHTALEALAQLSCDVLRRWDEAAEDDRVIAIVDQCLNYFDRLDEFLILVTQQRVRIARHPLQATSDAALVVTRVFEISPRRHVHALGGVVVLKIKYDALAHFVGLIDRVCVRRRGPRSQRCGRRRRARSERTKQRQRRPPAHALPMPVTARLEHRLTRVLQHALEQADGTRRSACS